ncbi:MAG: M42 family peptidase [Oscillospiraceae bacterium]|nr:M42 family peptidase [Oscillospiraceae bacterium]
MDRMRELLRQLCPVPGPSGYEKPAVRTAERMLSELTDRTETDAMGNLIAVRSCGKAGAGRILLDAHLDQVGFIVTGHEDGFLRFSTIGGVDPRVLPGHLITILTDPPISGVVACMPPHVQKRSDADRAPEIRDLFIDTGLSPERCRDEIPVGTPCVFPGMCFDLGKDRVCGSSLDDRACFACLVRTLELLQGADLDTDIVISGSSREEISGIGASAAMWNQAPDCCVAVDVTHAQTPDCRQEWINKLGDGPSVGIGSNITRWMGERFLTTAEREQIPYQREIMAGASGTNGWEMQISREGVATAILSLPIRYMHTPAEVLDLRDMENTAKLLAAFVTGLGEAVPS